MSKIIPGSRLTPHIIFCWAGNDVSFHLAMSMTHTKTNTKTKTKTKCFKDQMYAIFLKSRGLKDFKYDLDVDMSDMTWWTWTWRTNAKTKTNTKCFKDPMIFIFYFMK